MGGELKMSDRNKFSSLDVMKKDTKEYGGYSNYPTWATSLWLDLEIKEESAIANTLGLIINHGIYDNKDKIESLKNFVLYHFIDDFCSPNGLGCDLLGHALESIEWQEIIDRKITGIKSNLRIGIS